MENRENKKSKKKVIIPIVVVVVLLAAFGCWFTGLVGGISEAQAKDIAYGQIQGAKNTGEAIVNKEFDDGKMIYKVQVMDKGKLYEFEILARNGIVIGTDIQQASQSLQQTQSQSSPQDKTTGDIGVEKAKETALGQVKGAKAEDVVKAELDAESGIAVYEIEIKYDGMEYTFNINARTGEIMSQSSESVF